MVQISIETGFVALIVHCGGGGGSGRGRVDGGNVCALRSRLRKVLLMMLFAGAGAGFRDCATHRVLIYRRNRCIARCRVHRRHIQLRCIQFTKSFG